MSIFLWLMLSGAFALCVWIWTSDFGRQFPRRARRLGAPTEAGTDRRLRRRDRGNARHVLPRRLPRGAQSCP